MVNMAQSTMLKRIAKLETLQLHISARRRVAEAPDIFDEIDRRVAEKMEVVEAEGPMGVYFREVAKGRDGQGSLKMAREIGQLRINGVDERKGQLGAMGPLPHWKIYTAIPTVPAINGSTASRQRL
jgi:hypothetical protein